MSEPANNRQPHDRVSALTTALVVASLIGLYTLWVAHQPDPSANSFVYFFEQTLDYLILPGIIVGVIANAAIHLASAWVMAGVNFAIYFGIVYAAARFWEKRKAKRLSQAAKSP